MKTGWMSGSANELSPMGANGKGRGSNKNGGGGEKKNITPEYDRCFWQRSIFHLPSNYEVYTSTHIRVVVSIGLVACIV